MATDQPMVIRLTLDLQRLTDRGIRQAAETLLRAALNEVGIGFECPVCRFDRDNGSGFCSNRCRETGQQLLPISCIIVPGPEV